MDYVITKATPTGQGKARIAVVASTEAVDRHGDTVAASGWELGNFRKNPVILWAHQHTLPPVGRAVHTRVVGKRLEADIEFTPREVSEHGWRVGEMYRRGFLSAVSVGFIPKRWRHAPGDAPQPAEDGTVSRPPRGPMPLDYLQQELLEISAVPVPSNVQALARSATGGEDLTEEEAKQFIGWYLHQRAPDLFKHPRAAQAATPTEREIAEMLAHSLQARLRKALGRVD